MTDRMPEAKHCVQCEMFTNVVTIKLGPNRHIAYCSTKGCNNITPVISIHRRTALEVWNALQDTLRVSGWSLKKEPTPEGPQ